jgi:hypothetical protein
MRNWDYIEWEARQYQAEQQRQARVERLLRESRRARNQTALGADRHRIKVPRAGLWVVLRSAIASLTA